MSETNPTDAVYVLDHAHPNLHRHVFETKEDAEAVHSQVPGTLRVFTEEARWFPAASPPGDSRFVLVIYRTAGATRIIVALFGSESKWVALDHDMRRTYLDVGTVLLWREMPPVRPVEAPEGWVLTSARKPAPGQHVQFQVPGVTRTLVGTRETSDPPTGFWYWEDFLSPGRAIYSDAQVFCWRELTNP